MHPIMFTVTADRQHFEEDLIKRLKKKKQAVSQDILVQSREWGSWGLVYQCVFLSLVAGQSSGQVCSLKKKQWCLSGKPAVSITFNSVRLRALVHNQEQNKMSVFITCIQHCI